MTPRAFQKWCNEALQHHFEAREISAFCKILFTHRVGFTPTDHILSMDIPLETHQFQKLQSDVQRLIAHEPIQYILEETTFYGLPFVCKPVALIPRPETEELVHWILSDNPNVPLRIWDIGTGSGCIAVALKKNSPMWEVLATDISAAALTLAEENAHLNKVDCVFYAHDVLDDTMTLPMEKPVDAGEQVSGQHGFHEFQGFGQYDFPLLVGYHFGVVHLAFAIDDIVYIFQFEALGGRQGDFGYQAGRGRFIELKAAQREAQVLLKS